MRERGENRRRRRKRRRRWRRSWDTFKTRTHIMESGGENQTLSHTSRYPQGILAMSAWVFEESHNLGLSLSQYGKTNVRNCIKVDRN